MHGFCTVFARFQGLQWVLWLAKYDKGCRNCRAENHDALHKNNENSKLLKSECSARWALLIRVSGIRIPAGAPKSTRQIFVRCFFVVSFKILNIVIPFWLLSPLFIFSRSSSPSRTGWRRSCRCRWPPWPGTMPRTAPPDGNMPQHLPRSWNTFALGWGMPFADFTHTNNKHRAAIAGCT